MDTFRLVKKGIIVIISALIIGCGKEKKSKDGHLDNKITQDLQELESEILKQIKSEGEILGALNDSITNWKHHRLKGWYGDESKGEGKIDSLFALNKEKDKAIFVNLARDLTDGRLNALGYVYGVKIENRWYFFSGATQFVSRKDLSKPTPFSELHQVALKTVFQNYLKKSPTGEWEINERFFNQMINRNNPEAQGYKGGYGPCFQCQSFEEYALYLSALNWVQKFVPLQDNEIEYQWKNKNLKLKFPLKPAGNPYILPIKVAVRVWETKDDVNKQAAREDYDEDFEKVGEHQKIFERTIENLKPHTRYTIKITIHYSGQTLRDGTTHYYTNFTTP